MFGGKKVSREESAEGPRGKDLVSLIGAHFKSWIILRFVSKAGTGRECKTQKTIKSQLKSLTFYTLLCCVMRGEHFVKGGTTPVVTLSLFSF